MLSSLQLLITWLRNNFPALSPSARGGQQGTAPRTSRTATIPRTLDTGQGQILSLTLHTTLPINVETQLHNYFCTYLIGFIVTCVFL